MSRLMALAFILIALVGTVKTSQAQWSSNPAVNTAICTAANDQILPAVASDGSGGAIIAWQDFRSGATDGNIYAQRVNASGVAQWAADGVAICTAVRDQASPTLIGDGSGGAIIAWQDPRSGNSDYNIYAQRINASGAVQWAADGVAMCAAANNQLNPVLVSDGSGGAIIAWYDVRPFASSDIYAQRVNGSGGVLWTTDGAVICTAAGEQQSPIIISDGSGGAVMTWADGRVAFDDNIYAQRVNASGAVQWTANGVAVCTATETQGNPVLASDGSSGAIIAWMDSRNGGTNVDIYARRVNAAGAAQWAANGVAICAAANSQYYPNLVSDTSGGAIITWWDNRTAVDYDVLAQRVNASGAVQWAPDGVGVSTGSNDQDTPEIISDGSGGAIVGWSDSRNGFGNPDIYAQRISASGAGQWTAGGVAIATATGYQLSCALVSDGSGGAVITWMDGRSGTFNDIYAQLVKGTGQLGVPTSVENLAGTAPAGLRLEQNDPNPFNPVTVISYQLPTSSHVTLKVFDVLGREVATLVDGVEQAGHQSVTMDASRLASGTYMYRLTAGSSVVVKKLVIVK